MAKPKVISVANQKGGVDSLLYSGTYLFAGAPKVGKE